MKAIRVFYRKSDSQIVWSSSLEGDGVFPRTVEEELKKLPNIIVGATLTSEGTPLGGKSEDYFCIEIIDQLTISTFMASDSNIVVNRKLVTGTLRPIVIPEPVRDLTKEIDELKAKVANLEKG